MPNITIFGSEDPSDWDQTPTPVAQANARLRKARRAFADIRHARSYIDVWSGWSDFLIASAGIYTKLGRHADAAKWTPGWFSAKLLERKTARLLQYVHQARNQDEHGIHHVTIPYPSEVMSPDEPLLFIGGWPEWDEELRRWIPSGAPDPSTSWSIYPASGWLSPLVNRGVKYSVPQHHLGTKIPHPTVYWAAKLTLNYLVRLIDEAATSEPL